MKVLAKEMVQAALYMRLGLALADVRTVWLRGQLLLEMEFEGDQAEDVQAGWNGEGAVMVSTEDYRQLILELAKKAGER